MGTVGQFAPADTLLSEVQTLHNMPSYSYSSSSDDSRSMRASSVMPEQLVTALKVDYPRFRITGNMETGSAHVSYLSRPYFNYKVPSKYGFSKYITVRIIWIIQFLLLQLLK